MTDTDQVQTLVADLQRALGLSVQCGSITLNLNDGLLQSLKTEIHLRVLKSPVDRRQAPRHT